MRPLPTYMPRPRRAAAFDWKDPWRSGVQNLKSQDAIAGLLSRPLLALAVGTAEWVMRREPNPAPRDKLFGDLVDACWAAVIDRRYLKLVSEAEQGRVAQYWRLSREARHDHTLWAYPDIVDRDTGPRWVALHHVLQAADRTNREEGPALEAVYLSQLARQVFGTSASSPYAKWRKAVMARFHAKATYDDYWTHPRIYRLPKAKRDELGPPLPPQVVDPTIPFTVADAPPLIDAFLRGLAPDDNPFLTSARELKTLGVTTPYRFPR